MRCLNEATEGSTRDLFRAWDRRLEGDGQALESNEDDPELLLHIPFDGAVKLKAICIIGESARACCTPAHKLAACLGSASN